jgi:hypothetical protein
MNIDTTTGSALTDHERSLLAQHFLSVLRDENWNVFASMLTDNASWKMPGSNVLSGNCTGAASITENARILMSFEPSFHLKNVQLSYSGFVLSVHLQAQAGSKVLSQHAAIMCTLEGDRISVINFLMSDLRNLNEFFDSNLSHFDDSPASPVSKQLQSAIASTFLTAMTSNDWDMMRSIMEPDLQWTLPGKSLLSGPANGVEAVVKRALSLKKFGVMFQLMNILYGWDGVALSLHNTANRGSLILNEYVTIAFRLGASNITGMTTHLSDVPGIEAFFVPGIID